VARRAAHDLDGLIGGIWFDIDGAEDWVSVAEQLGFLELRRYGHEEAFGYLSDFHRAGAEQEGSSIIRFRPCARSRAKCQDEHN
jgi:hypothetical protein